MKFEIESWYDVGDKVETPQKENVTIVAVRLKMIGKVVNIEYLIEYTDGVRLWKNQDIFCKGAGIVYGAI